MALTGNKGEWSEVYVFLKLLADGKLNAADANLNAIPNIYYPIIKILRQEASSKKEFVINSNIDVVDGNTNSLIASFPIKDFVAKSQELFKDIKNAEGRSHSFPLIEDFLNSITVNSIKALNTDKSDIRVVVHDLNTGLKPTLGFSIKSLLGGDSTLFNPGAGTNFIYKIEVPQGESFDYELINEETYLKSKKIKDSKISLRLKEIERLNFKVQFYKIQSDTLQQNLILIDSQLPELLSYIVYFKYRNSVSKLKDLIQEVNKNNPLGFNVSKGHPFYEYKIKNFLAESALGMTPETVWTGLYDATGGIIIVKETGDIVCYHIYNKNEFQEYLLNNTYMEQAATSEDEDNPGQAKTIKAKPYKFGWIYQENDTYFIKLNLQIRFI